MRCNGDTVRCGESDSVLATLLEGNSIAYYCWRAEFNSVRIIVVCVQSATVYWRYCLGVDSVGA